MLNFTNAFAFATVSEIRSRNCSPTCPYLLFALWGEDPSKAISFPSATLAMLFFSLAFFEDVFIMSRPFLFLVSSHEVRQRKKLLRHQRFLLSGLFWTFCKELMKGCSHFPLSNYIWKESTYWHSLSYVKIRSINLLWLKYISWINRPPFDGQWQTV